MSVRQPWALAVLVLCLVPARALRAEKLDPDSKKWLEGVGALITPEEEKIFKGLKDKADRDEFQKIFWGRRNPRGPDAPQNEFRAAFEKARPEVDVKYKVGGTLGSATDCGRVVLLLGEPNEVKKVPPSASVAAGPRGGEIWTLRDRPGLTFPEGHLDVSFDGFCMIPVPEGTRFREQLGRVAQAKILSPQIAYPLGGDGHVRKLVDQLPKPTPMQALLQEPRQDFAMTSETTMFLRGADGSVYMAGLMKGDGRSFTPAKPGEAKTGKVLVACQAVDEAGLKSSSAERQALVELAADGSFLASFGLALKAGSYSLRVGILDPKTGKGSATSAPLKTPDFSSGELSISSVLILQELVENPPKDPEDALGDFSLGTAAKVIPRFGNVFSQSDSMKSLALFYNGKVDPATSKAAVAVSLQILKDGKQVAQAPEDSYDTPSGSYLVGPVPLKSYAPGKYLVKLKVKDNVAKKEYSQEATLEVR